MTVVGVKESFKKSISILEQDIQRYSVGIRCQITHEVIDGKDVVTLYFFRVNQLLILRIDEWIEVFTLNSLHLYL